MKWRSHSTATVWLNFRTSVLPNRDSNPLHLWITTYLQAQTLREDSSNRQVQVHNLGSTYLAVEPLHKRLVMLPDDLLQLCRYKHLETRHAANSCLSFRGCATASGSNNQPFQAQAKEAHSKAFILSWFYTQNLRHGSSVMFKVKEARVGKYWLCDRFWQQKHGKQTSIFLLQNQSKYMEILSIAGNYRKDKPSENDHYK